MAMSIRSAAPGKSTRRWLAGGTAAALMTLSIPLLAMPTASAANNFGPFEIDGDLVAGSGATDWGNVGVGNVVTVLDNKSTTSNQDDTTFKSNSKEYDAVGSGNGWPNWDYQAANNAADKTDFGRVAMYNTTTGSGDDAVQWTYVGFDRGSATGTGKFAVELNQIKQAGLNANPLRSEGDVRFIVWDQGNGAITLVGDGQNPDVGAYIWNDPDSNVQGFPDSNSNGDWVKISNVAAAANFKGAVNSGAVDVPTWWTSNNVVNGKVGTDQFVEFGFNLTGLGATLGCPSQGFKAWNMRSLTGTGNTGALKDYIEAQSINIRSTCGTIVLKKESIDGSGVAGAEFTITPDPTPGSDEESLTVTTGPDGTVTVSPAVPGTYTITETTAPLGYILVPWTQEITLDDSGTSNYVAINPLGDIRWTKTYEGYTDTFPQGFTGQQFTVKRTAGIALTNAQFESISGIAATNCATACTFQVTDNGARDANPDFGKIRVNDLPVGTYEITETAGGQPVGFGPDNAKAIAVVVDYLDETPTNDQGDYINYLATATVQGSTAPTTFTNPRLPAKLSVKKLGQPGDVLIQGAVFDLYKVVGTKDAAPGTGDDVKVGQVTTGANGIGTSGNLAWGSSYYFVEISVPAPWNLPDNRVTAAVALTAADATAQAGGQAPQVLTVNDPRSAIVTDAQDSANLPAAVINDVATVSGIRNDAGGTITFTAYGPFDTADQVGVCVVGNQAFTWTSPSISGKVVNNSVTVTSADFTASKAGYYYWVASYSGDPATGTLGVTGVCGDPTEISEVLPAEPGISTVADGDTELPSATLYDVATVTGLNPGATGTVTFDLYGVGDTQCLAAPIYSTTEDLGDVMEDNGVWYAKVTSTATVVNAPGTYRWIASYSGDDDNLPVSGACNDANENWTVDKAPTDITTTATATATLPNAQISDSATVTGLTSDGSGSITFRLYGPVTGDDPQPTCEVQVGSDMVVTFTKTDVVGGTVTKSSPSVTVNVAGSYYWIASYSGDANNEPSAGACGDTGETSVVLPGQPTIVTVATETVQLGAGDAGAQITDTATIANLTPNAGGSVTFEVFGPFESVEAIVCSAPALESETKNLTTPVNGSVTISSSAITVYDTGIYAWKVTYSGDDNNKEVTHECGLVDRVNKERSTVTPTTPELTTVATEAAVLPIGPGASVTIYDTVTITGLSQNAKGEVTFEVYGPSDEPICEKPLATLNAGDVEGLVGADGTYQTISPSFEATAPGTYWWIARYASSTDNNPSLAGECGDENESTVVTQGEPGIAKIVESPAGTAITGAVEVGTVLHYTVTVSNTGTAPAKDDVTDVLPEGLGAPTNITNGGTYDAGTRTITWTQVELAGGATLELEYDAVVLASAAAEGKDTLINVASWFDLSADTTTVVKWITVVAEPFCDVDTPRVNYAITTHNLDEIDWTADLEWVYADGPNAGQVVDPEDVPTTQNGVEQTLDGVQLTGTLLYPGTRTVDGAAVDWPGWKNVGTADAPIWQVDGDGLRPSVILRATVNPTAESEAIYPASAAECNPPGVPGLDKSSPTEVGSDDRPSGNVAPGETVRYVITLTNNGGQDVTSDLVDTLPAGVGDPRNFTVDTEGFTAAPSVNGQTLTWANVTLEPGQTVVYEFDVTVTAQPGPGEITDLFNDATWAGIPDRTQHIVAGPGVEVTPTLDKDSDPASGTEVPIDSVITYTVKVGNDGNVPLTGDLVDTLPAGIEVVGNYTRDDGGKAEPDTATATKLVWNGVTVQPGQVVTFTYQIKVLNAALDADSLVNTAEWLGLEDGTEHTVKQPDLPVTGAGSDPLLVLGWAGALLTLGVMLVLATRGRREREV